MTIGEEGSVSLFGSDVPCPHTRFVRLELIETWGDIEVGITALKLFDPKGCQIPLSRSAISLHTRDSKGKLAPAKDVTLSRLVDGVDLTTDENHMWSVPFSPRMVLSIDLGMSRAVKAIKIHNYNASLEESFRGLKYFEVHFDQIQSQTQGRETYMTRKAPGVAVFDFGHQIDLRGTVEEAGPRPMTAQPSRSANEALHSAFERARRNSSHNDAVRQDYMTPLFPYGYIVRLELLGTWGDPHYMGLNGIELYDCFNNRIPLDMGNLHAMPDSVRHLAGMEKDVRTLDKLVDGVNATRDDRHMWLVPNTIGIPALVWVCLEEPMSLSKVKFWNYSKTPKRGVKEFAIFVDDNMVYKGLLRQAGPMSEPSKPQTVLFTNDADVMRHERDHVFCSEDTPADGVVFMEEGKECDI